MSKRSAEDDGESNKKIKTTAEVANMTLDESDYLDLLRIFIGHTEKLQNNVDGGLIPQEDLIADAAIEYLADYSEPKGPLKIKKHTYVEGRSNLIVIFPAASPTKEVMSFVGAHMDVVPANRSEWSREPFRLEIEGDKLFGRGVTDCLGHVAMLCHLLKRLAVARAQLSCNVVVVFISSEEGGKTGIGVDMLVEHGELEFLKNGPFYWVDSANFGPTMGTAGMIQWQLIASGKLFHSGFPNKAINPLTFGTQAVALLQQEFYRAFPQTERDLEYKFLIGSSMKPTQISCPPGSINQIPLTCTISGDIRLLPFYDARDVQALVERKVAELNENPNLVPHWGYESYVLADEKKQASLTLKWLNEPSRGVAVDLNSRGYKALEAAICEVHPEAKSFSLSGTLPLVADLKDRGFDIQICGFGDMAAYHAINEYALLSHLAKGFQVCAKLVDNFNQL
jgi:acetylornithine deacetylase